MRRAQLAVREFKATPVTVNCADDVAVAVLDRGLPTLEEATE
jgi:hypothetical protein